MTRSDNSVVANPVYWPIEDGDWNSVAYFEAHGIPVKKIALNGVPHLYAIIGAETPEQAEETNRKIGNAARKQARDLQKRVEHETSYDALVEAGYDSAIDGDDPSELAAEMVVVEALCEELKSLTEEKKRLCKMIANKESERSVAKELGIAQTTLNGRKKKLLAELAESLKEYR
ncbi:MAG: hypothetical protein LUI12_05275 [Clostridiales bacterium]|nr:hypothetical protein [Clostridiales bacterium]